MRLNDVARLLLWIGVFASCSLAFAASAENAYVVVTCDTQGVETIVPVDDDFYITTRDVSSPPFEADSKSDAGQRSGRGSRLVERTCRNKRHWEQHNLQPQFTCSRGVHRHGSIKHCFKLLRYLQSPNCQGGCIRFHNRPQRKLVHLS